MRMISQEKFNRMMRMPPLNVSNIFQIPAEYHEYCPFHFFKSLTEIVFCIPSEVNIILVYSGKTCLLVFEVVSLMNLRCDPLSLNYQPNENVLLV